MAGSIEARQRRERLSSLELSLWPWGPLDCRRQCQAFTTSKEELESVTRVPPQKAADLRIAIHNYDSVFQQPLPAVPKPRPKPTASRRRAVPWR
jgi:hypothetical protein